MFTDPAPRQTAQEPQYNAPYELEGYSFQRPCYREPSDIDAHRHIEYTVEGQDVDNILRPLGEYPQRHHLS
jgi:hypothetical protein